MGSISYDERRITVEAQPSAPGYTAVDNTVRKLWSSPDRCSLEDMSLDTTMTVFHNQRHNQNQNRQRLEGGDSRSARSRSG